MVDFIQMLQHHFSDEPVYVSGNLFIYYEPGNTRTPESVAPDVFVVHGVAKKRRRTYLTWEEGKTPDFVLEVSSHSTHRNDIREKKALVPYLRLRIHTIPMCLKLRSTTSMTRRVR